MALTKNYDDKDLACHGEWEENIEEYGRPCGCGGRLPEIDPILITLIDEIADVCQKRFETIPGINCCYRCDVHNEDVGGKPGINHNAVPCYAVDLDASEIGVEELAAVAEELKADGVGRYFDNNFVHVDVRDGRIDAGYRWNG